MSFLTFVSRSHVVRLWEIPDNGVAETKVVYFSLMGKVSDLHHGDSIEVLEVVNTGGIFFTCSSLPLFGGVGYLTKIYTKNRETDKVNCETFTISKLNDTQTGSSFQYLHKYIYNIL